MSRKDAVVIFNRPLNEYDIIQRLVKHQVSFKTKDGFVSKDDPQSFLYIETLSFEDYKPFINSHGVRVPFVNGSEIDFEKMFESRCDELENENRNENRNWITNEATHTCVPYPDMIFFPNQYVSKNTDAVKEICRQENNNWIRYYGFNASDVYLYAVSVDTKEATSV